MPLIKPLKLVVDVKNLYPQHTCTYNIHVNTQTHKHTHIYTYIYTYICTSVFDKLIWHTIGPKSFLFGTAWFSLWASGAVSYDYILSNSINSLLIGLRFIPNGAYLNHFWAKTQICTYICIYIHTYVHTYIHIHTYIHTYIYICYTFLHLYREE